MEKQDKQKCLYCNKSLVTIGNKRSNGKYNLCDWNSRKYHKKCWADLQKEAFVNKIMKDF